MQCIVPSSRFQACLEARRDNRLLNTESSLAESVVISVVICFVMTQLPSKRIWSVYHVLYLVDPYSQCIFYSVWL